MLTDKDMQKYEMQAEILAAIAHPLRVAIVQYLSDGERSVGDIAEHLGANRSNVSRHLSVMNRAGLTVTRKEGVTVYYSLRTPCILNFFSCAMDVLKHNLKENTRALR